MAALESPNGTVRDLAQQLLLWNDDSDAVELLEQLAADGKRPTARLHALCTLDGLDALSDELMLATLRDEHAGVQRHAIRLAERRLKDSPQLTAAAIALVDSPDSKCSSSSPTFLAPATLLKPLAA